MVYKTVVLKFKGVCMGGIPSKLLKFRGKDSEEHFWQGEENIEILMPKVIDHMVNRIPSLTGNLPKTIELKIVY